MIKKKTTNIFACLICSFLAGCDAPENHAQPKLPYTTLYKPTFNYKSSGEHTVGHMFAVEHTNGTFMVTAQHLFGKAGGLDRQLSPEEIPEELSSVLAKNISTGQSTNIGEYVIFPNASTLSKEGAENDLAVFRTTELHGLKLATNKPKEDEIVWLYSSLKKQKPGDSLLHPAKVWDVDERFIKYSFLNRSINLRATSGAPLLNQKGEVVGIHVGGIPIPYVITMGLAGPTDNLVAILSNSRN